MEKTAAKRRPEECLERTVFVDMTDRLGVRLTPREIQVCIALIEAPGMTNKDLATKLVCGLRTVKFHISQILGKLNLAGRQQLAAWASQNRDVLMSSMSVRTLTPVTFAYAGPWGTLRPRERDIARLATRGLSDHEIAKKLGISEFSITLNLRLLYRVFDCRGKSGRSRLELARYLAENGLSREGLETVKEQAAGAAVVTEIPKQVKLA